MNCRIGISEQLENAIKKLHEAFMSAYDDDAIVPDDIDKRFDAYVFEHGSPELVKAYKQYLKDIEHDEDM